MTLVKQVYDIINKLPCTERYALADQMRRSAISIPSNIAEGYERNSTKEYIQFLSIANGSKAELMTQIEICKTLNYIQNTQEIENLGNEIGKMLNTIIKKLTPTP